MAKRAPHVDSMGTAIVAKGTVAKDAQEDGGDVESANQVDATAVFLALHASLTREKQEDRPQVKPSNVIAFRAKKAA